MTTAALSPARFSWRKLTSPKLSEDWLEKLDFLGPQRVMVIELAGSKNARVEAHGITKQEGEELVRDFGGQITEAKWLTAVNPPDRAPIRVRGRLLVLSTDKEMETHVASGATTPALLIPAGMAFGTGEHATTSTCLRLLVDVAKAHPAGSWEMLDLGTGTGILAIAARKLGARKVLAGDFDSESVRTTKENAKVNDVDKVVVKKLDVLEWTPDRTWNVVCANIYSELLIQGAPKIAAATASGGKVIFSGILHTQAEEVVQALKKAGLEIEKIVRRGKWCSGLATKST